jgi:uncharacterized Zn finger protein (UPF0148 family)
MYRDIFANGYVPNYTHWIYHGERHRIREEVVRPLLKEFDADVGMADLMADYHEARFVQGMEVEEEDPEETAKAYYTMMEAAKKPLHENTIVSQLDAISRLIALKSSLGISRDGFDLVLAVVGQLLPEVHFLSKNTYESQRLLCALKMSYDTIQACKNGCVLFRGDHETTTHCPKCKASRYVQVEGSDGSKKQSKIPEMVIRHLPILQRLQRLYMTEESAKQMTWHKNGKRYSDKMQHPADGDAWRHFNDMNPDKAGEARNVRVALATDGFNPFGMMATPYTCWPVFVIPLNLPPGVMFEPRNMFLTLIIPGHPGNNISMFMQPVWDELQRAWEEGVLTYDRATKRREAARPILYCKQRHRAVLCSDAEPDPKRRLGKGRITNPHSVSAAEQLADDGGISGKCSFICRSLVSHMMYLAFTYHQPCGCNIAGPDRTAAG